MAHSSARRCVSASWALHPSAYCDESIPLACVSGTIDMVPSSFITTSSSPPVSDGAPSVSWTCMTKRSSMVFGRDSSSASFCNALGLRRCSASGSCQGMISAQRNNAGQCTVHCPAMRQFRRTFEKPVFVCSPDCQCCHRC